MAKSHGNSYTPVGARDMMTMMMKLQACDKYFSITNRNAKKDIADHLPRFSHRRDSNSTATLNWALTDFNTSPTLTANSISPPRISLHIAFCKQISMHSMIHFDYIILLQSSLAPGTQVDSIQNCSLTYLLYLVYEFIINIYMATVYAIIWK